MGIPLSRTESGVDQALKDRQREKDLQSLGLQVIRYTNDEVLNNLEGVLEDLEKRLSL